MECNNIAKKIIVELGETAQASKSIITEFKEAHDNIVTFFDSLLESIYEDVPGLEDFHEYLKSTSFYTDPASYKYHNAFFGGLLDHSLNVYMITKKKLENYGLTQDIPKRTAILVPLLHDVCKIGSYNVGFNWRKNSRGKWENYPGYRFNTDLFPAGHGEKSVFIISEYIKLSKLEMLAIRWHSGAFEEGVLKRFMDASALNEFVPIVHTADFEASIIVESQGLVECLVEL